MNRGLCDTLTLGGTTEFNCKMRWKAKINKRKLAGEIVDIPGDFVDLPRFYDHSFLHYLNERAKNCSLPPIFDDVHLVGENNGEVYLSKYFEEQMVRNTLWGQDKKTSMCQCPTCTTYMTKNKQHTRVFAPFSQAKNNNHDEMKRKHMLMNSPLMVPVPPPSTVVVPAAPPGAFFGVAPVPLAELAYGGWMPRPHDCCYMIGNHHYCATYAGYLRRKYAGVRVLGKPPHDSTCPVRRHFHH